MDPSKKIVAIKRYKSNKSQAQQDFLYEVEVMKAGINCPEIIPLLGYCQPDSKTCLIVTEFYRRKTLWDVLKSNVELPWPLRWQMSLETAKAFKYLHQCYPPIYHRDIKSGNLFVTEDWHIRVGDFDLSAILTDSLPPTRKGPAGTTPWMAPELLSADTNVLYTEKCETYSYGIVLYEIATRLCPFATKVESQIPEHVLQGFRLEIDSSLKIPNAFIELIQNCWAHNPKDRPDFTTIVARIEANMSNC